MHGGSGVGGWLAESAAARAVYDVTAATVRGDAGPEEAVRRAANAPGAVWERVLVLEGCGAWLDHVRRTWPGRADAFAPAHGLARAEGERALRNSVAMVQQLAELAKVAAAIGVPVLVLKGSARLLAGEIAGARSMADIDLLVPGEGGADLHDALRSRLGYAADEPGTPDRHFPSLIREGSLPVEIHRRLSDEGSSLDCRIWAGTRRVALDGATVEIPEATALLLHTLDHAAVVHRGARYRLRDIVDVATAWEENVDASEVRRFLRRHTDRLAAMTLLAVSRSVAGVTTGWAAEPVAERSAWRRVRRVARTRLLAPPQAGVPPASDPRVQVLSRIAEGGVGSWLRLLSRGASSPRRAARLLTGRWLPVEAERAREASIAADRESARERSR